MRLRAKFEEGLIQVEQQGGYSPEAKIILRSVAQGYERKGATWRYPYSLGAISSLKEAADFLSAELDLDDQLVKAWEAAEQETQRERSVRRLIQRYIDDPQLPLADYMTREDIEPWHHQKIAYHWAMRTNVLYLAHKPGLGKTREGADIIRGKIQAGHVRAPEQVWIEGHYSEIFPSQWVEPHWGIRGGILIICPKIVLGTWEDELARWQGIPSVLITGGRPRKIWRGGLDFWIHVCTYDSLDVIQDNEYDGIVADEAHYLANDDTKRFAKALHLRQRARWVVALSGTPVSNMLPSLWSQYYWLDGGRTLGASFESYRRQYFDGSYRNMVAKDSSAANIARQISRVTYFLTMQQAFPDKQGKIQQVMKIPMTRQQITYYNEVRRQAVADIMTGSITAEAINVKLLKLLQICQGFVIDDNKQVCTFTSAKLEALRGMLTGQGDLTDRRTIVWCQFRHDLNQVVRMLQKAGVKVLWLHGGMNNKERERVRDMWNHDAQWQVLVGMIQMGIGINLHAPNCVDANGEPARCATTIFYGYNWRVTQLEQAMDRIYRGDQVETCLYRYLISDDVDGFFDNDGNKLRPIDGQVYESLQAKLEQATEISEESMDYIRRLLAA